MLTFHVVAIDSSGNGTLYIDLISYFWHSKIILISQVTHSTIQVWIDIRVTALMISWSKVLYGKYPMIWTTYWLSKKSIALNWILWWLISNRISSCQRNTSTFFLIRKIILKRLCPNNRAQLTFLTVWVTSVPYRWAKYSTTSPYPCAVSISPEPVWNSWENSL